MGRVEECLQLHTVTGTYWMKQSPVRPQWADLPRALRGLPLAPALEAGSIQNVIPATERRRRLALLHRLLKQDARVGEIQLVVIVRVRGWTASSRARAA